MYDIKEVSDQYHLAIPTLHYYEREGLLPEISRNEAGHRIYSDSDIEWLKLICCLRDTGMPITNIKHYVTLCKSNESTIDERYEIFVQQKRTIENQIELLHQNLKVIDRKLDYYLRKKEELYDPLNPNKKRK